MTTSWAENQTYTTHSQARRRCLSLLENDTPPGRQTRPTQHVPLAQRRSLSLLETHTPLGWRTPSSVENQTHKTHHPSPEKVPLTPVDQHTSRAKNQTYTTCSQSPGKVPLTPGDSHTSRAENHFQSGEPTHTTHSPSTGKEPLTPGNSHTSGAENQTHTTDPPSPEKVPLTPGDTHLQGGEPLPGRRSRPTQHVLQAQGRCISLLETHKPSGWRTTSRAENQTHTTHHPSPEKVLLSPGDSHTSGAENQTHTKRSPSPGKVPLIP